MAHRAQRHTRAHPATGLPGDALYHYTQLPNWYRRGYTAPAPNAPPAPVALVAAPAAPAPAPAPAPVPAPAPALALAPAPAGLIPGLPFMVPVPHLRSIFAILPILEVFLSNFWREDYIHLRALNASMGLPAWPAWNHLTDHTNTAHPIPVEFMQVRCQNLVFLKRQLIDISQDPALPARNWHPHHTPVRPAAWDSWYWEKTSGPRMQCSNTQQETRSRNLQFYGCDDFATGPFVGNPPSHNPRIHICEECAVANAEHYDVTRWHLDRIWPICWDCANQVVAGVIGPPAFDYPCTCANLYNAVRNAHTYLCSTCHEDRHYTFVKHFMLLRATAAVHQTPLHIVGARVYHHASNVKAMDVRITDWDQQNRNYCLQGCGRDYQVIRATWAAHPDDPVHRGCLTCQGYIRGPLTFKTPGHRKTTLF